MLEEKLLLWKFNRGRKDVLRRIYEKYKDDMMTLASALLYDKSSADDVVHDVFIAIIRSCGKLQVTENLKGYLAICVVNSVRNRNKAEKSHQIASLEQITPIAPDSNRPDFSAMFGEQSQHLAQALSQLPYQQREVLLFHIHSGLKFRKIAELEGQSINTIIGRYRYGLDKLRLLLNSETEK
jgi:RNA polymerase sigma-70 factor (ECF subfamily)